MTSIVLLEIISMVSFIYSLLLIFFSFAPINQIYMVFIWTILVSFVFGISYKKFKFHQLSILLLLSPLIYYQDSTSVYFILMTSILIYLYIKKSLRKGSYNELIRRLKLTYILYTLLITIALLSKGFHNFISYSLPFIITYLLSTIILVRSLRHLETGMDIDKLKKVNRKYIIIISGISFIVTVDGLRNFVFGIVRIGYNFVVNILLTIAYYPVLLIYNTINKLIGYLLDLANEFGALEQLIDEIFPEDLQAPDPEIVFEYSSRLSKVMEVILIIIIIIIIYKIISKLGDRHRQAADYIEEREYIRKPKTRRRFFRERFPKDLKEQIRYYYRRYLEKLEKSKVELFTFDTSLDVNKKAKGLNEEEIERIREIYIDARYGEKKVDPNMVKEIEKLYKDL